MPVIQVCYAGYDAKGQRRINLRRKWAIRLFHPSHPSIGTLQERPLNELCASVLGGRMFLDGVAGSLVVRALSQ